MFGSVRVALIIPAFFVLIGCTVKVDSPNISVEPNIHFPKCSATLPASLNGAIDADTAFLINVEASEGVGPYTIAGTNNKFASQTTVSRQFSNDTNADIVVDDFVEIRDALGLPGSCSFSITVRPKTTNPGTLACAMTVSNDSPHVNSSITISATASGGGGTYTFSNLALGTDGIVVTALSQGSGLASAVAKWTSGGARTISLTLTDGTSSISCSKNITVRPAVSVSAVATPSSSVSTESTITVTASSDGFAGTPSYSFSTNDPYVNIVTNGSIATVTSTTSNISHSFYLGVTATSQGESAFVSIPLSFTVAAPLTCTLSHPSGTYNVNDAVTFSLTANTNEAVQIVTFDAGGGAITASPTSSRTVKFSTGGTKWVSATGKVRRNNTDVYCNTGAAAYDSVNIGTTLSCNVSTSPNPSYIDDYYSEIFDLNVTVPSGSGIGSSSIVSVTSTGSSYGIQYYSYSSSLSRRYYFQESGSFTVTAKIQDSIGNQATCSTTHLSSWWPYWWY